MLCQTIKQGKECSFMGKHGCGYNGGACRQIIDSCQGCGKALTLPGGIYCQAFPDPESKWRRGPCNLATHVRREAEKVVKINPLKASKRSAKK